MIERDEGFQKKSRWQRAPSESSFSVVLTQTTALWSNIPLHSIAEICVQGQTFGMPQLGFDERSLVEHFYCTSLTVVKQMLNKVVRWFKVKAIPLLELPCLHQPDGES